MTKLEQILFEHIHIGYYRQTVTISCRSHNEYIAQLTDSAGGRALVSATGDTISEAIEALQKLLAKREEKAT